MSSSEENSIDKLLPSAEPPTTNELTDSLRLRVSNAATDVNVEKLLEQQTTPSITVSDASGTGPVTVPVSVATANATSVPSVAPIEEILRTRERHVFIVSESGKPVYSRYGSLEQLVTLVGVMQALHEFVKSSYSTQQPENPALMSVSRAHMPRASSTSNLPVGTPPASLSSSLGRGLLHSGPEGSSHKSAADSREALRTIQTGDRLIVFLPREPLLCICVGMKTSKIKLNIQIKITHFYFVDGTIYGLDDHRFDLYLRCLLYLFERIHIDMIV